MRNIIILMFIFYSFFVSAYALSSKSDTMVFSEGGNIYLKDDHQTLQLTNSGKDFSPLLSPEAKKIAFIRNGNKPIPEECKKNTESDFEKELWVYDVSQKKEKLLVKNNFQCNQPEQQISDFLDLAFSPNNELLYFITPAWMTSGALHVVKTNRMQQHFVAPANSVEIVMNGSYKGYLIVNQHRYFTTGGSYDWFWLLNPENTKEIPLGPEITKEQRDFMGS